MSGMAIFTNDIRMDNAYFAQQVRSTKAHAKLVKIKVPKLPKNYYFISAKDIPGENVCNIIFSDWPVFADKEVNYIGETLGILVGPDKGKVIDLAAQVEGVYEDLPTNFMMTESYIHKEFTKGDVSKFKKAKKVYEETFYTGYQEQVYLETQAMLMYLENDQIVVKASMQCPFYIHKAVCRVLGCNTDRVRVIQPAVGGAFGGKEHYPSLMAAQLATAIVKIKKPIRMTFDRKEDISFTTKRHPSITHITGGQGGFAGTGMADEGKEFAGADFHVHVPDGGGLEGAVWLIGMGNMR